MQGARRAPEPEPEPEPAQRSAAAPPGPDLRARPPLRAAPLRVSAGFAFPPGSFSSDATARREPRGMGRRLRDHPYPEPQVRRWRRAEHGAGAPLPCASLRGGGRRCWGAPLPQGPAAAWRGRPAAAAAWFWAPGPEPWPNPGPAPAQPRPGSPALPNLLPQPRRLQCWLLRGANKTQFHHSNRTAPKRYPTASHPRAAPRHRSRRLARSTGDRGRSRRPGRQARRAWRVPAFVELALVAQLRRYAGVGVGVLGRKRMAPLSRG